MLPANCMGVGMEICAPNMMVTPIGVPVVGINMAMDVTKVPPCPTILFTAQPALNLLSIAPVTISIPPMIPPCLPGMHTMGIPTILLMCIPATNFAMCTAMGNGGCAPMGATLVPNVTTVLFMYASGPDQPEPGGPAMTLEDLREIEQSLSGSMVESAMLAGGVGYVFVRRFSSTVPSAVTHAVRTMTADGMRSLLIDLRGNRGGELEASVQLAATFLEPGSVIATMTDIDGDDVVYRSQPGSTCRLPIAVLVDGGTASAAELFAGSLKAHGRAVVVGDRSYGKGEVGVVFVSSENKATYGIAGRITLPHGGHLQGVGVESDLPWPSGDLVSWAAAAAERMDNAVCDAIVALSTSGPPRVA